ncbi:alpha/beta fold hydrolase, partial [Serratia marcescens]
MTSFTLSSDDWLTRETQFAAFATGPLLDFWRLREEGEFSGVDGVPIRFVRFRSARHQRVVVVSPGRIESYVKYPEVAYDLFHCGYDVVIVDHRGQGRSGRLLADTHRGHVVNFADYVD